MQDFDYIETPENVELQRRLAGIGTRVYAGFIDSMILGATYTVLFLLLIIIGINPIEDIGFSNSMEIWTLSILILVGFAIYWGYFMLFETITNGKTIGKKIIKIRVVQKEGQGVPFNSIAVRNLLRAVDGLGLYSIGIISMFVTKKAQRLGDIAAGTVVISEAMPEYSANFDKKTDLTVKEAHTAEGASAVGLSVEEYRLLQNYWSRRNEFNLKTRKRLLSNLLIPILERLYYRPARTSVVDLERHLKSLLDKTAKSLPQE